VSILIVSPSLMKADVDVFPVSSLAGLVTLWREIAAQAFG